METVIKTADDQMDQMNPKHAAFLKKYGSKPITDDQFKEAQEAFKGINLDAKAIRKKAWQRK